MQIQYLGELAFENTVAKAITRGIGKSAFLLGCCDLNQFIFMRLFYSFQMRIPHGFLTTATLLTLTAVTPGKALRCSQTSEYAIKNENGEVVRCQKCPTCGIGEGLAVECGISVKEGTQLDCITCTERENFSNTNDRSLCEPCSECVNREVKKQCSRSQDRECGSCLPGYEEDRKEYPPGCKKKPATKLIPSSNTTPTRVSTTPSRVSATPTRVSVTPTRVSATPTRVSTTPTRVSVAPNPAFITTRPNGEKDKEHSGDESIGIILGAVLGCTVVLLLVIGILSKHFCRSRQSKGKDTCNTV